MWKMLYRTTGACGSRRLLKIAAPLFIALLCCYSVVLFAAEGNDNSKSVQLHFIQQRSWQNSRVAARGVQYFNGKMRASFGSRRGAWLDFNSSSARVVSSTINQIGLQYHNGKLRAVFKQQTGEWIDLLQFSNSSRKSIVKRLGFEYRSGRLRYLIGSHHGDWIRVRRSDTKATQAPITANFPKQLAAYVLHTQYLFSAARNANNWYYGKKITISGLVDLKKISRVPPNMLIGKAYSGEFIIPMLSGRIKCLIGEKSPLLSPKNRYPDVVCGTKILPGGKKLINIKYSSRANKIKQQLFIVTCEGVLHKGLQYKTAILANAKVLSVREIKAQYQLKPSAVLSKSYHSITSLYHSNQLVQWGWLRLFFVSTKMGSILCQMGPDPEDRAEELICARKLARKKFKRIETKISIAGLKIANSTSDLEECAVTAWHITQRQ